MRGGRVSDSETWAFVAWWPHSRRGEVFARALGGRLYCIYNFPTKGALYAPLRYFLQAVRTLRVLFAERPSVVYAQNPPFVCGLVVYLYHRVTAARFVLDHHSAAFAQVWDWAAPVQRFVARRAVTNIVTNQHWAEVVASWGAHALVMGDPFLELPTGEPFPLAETAAFHVAVVSTFSPDEPLEAVVGAAARLPDVHFYITGDGSRYPRSFFEKLPPNVICTGFLPDARYFGLLRAADAVMVLTTRNHTLQLGGCEAVSLCRPLITSDWPFLREFFPRGTVHVANTADNICAGVEKMRREHHRLRQEMSAFRQIARRRWEEQVECLRVLLAEGSVS